MAFATFSRDPLEVPIVATAVHNGHELRPEVEELMLLDADTRLREEDPFTDFFAAAFEAFAVVHRSRFEVDLNRVRDRALYSEPDDAWGLDLWRGDLPAQVRSESLRLYDQFYADLTRLLDEVVAAHGGFVLYDLHSYNHRRGGADFATAPEAENPAVNVGTGSVPGGWNKVSGAFIEEMSRHRQGDNILDVRENVKFRGQRLAGWVHEHYGKVACALAIELKKTWMDEWTGTVDSTAQQELRDALLATVGPVTEAWRSIAGQ